jgi:hypothetical protein
MFEVLNQIVEIFGESVLAPHRELKVRTRTLSLLPVHLFHLTTETQKYYDRCSVRPRLRMYLDHRKPRAR